RAGVLRGIEPVGNCPTDGRAARHDQDPHASRDPEASHAARAARGGHSVTGPTPSRESMGEEQLRAATRARLLARAAADAQSRGLSATTPVRRSTRSVLIGGLTLALAASLVFAIVTQRQRRLDVDQFATSVHGTRQMLDSP